MVLFVIGVDLVRKLFYYWCVFIGWCVWFDLDYVWYGVGFGDLFGLL